MRITPQIKKAIQQAIEAKGNLTQFAKSLGLAHSTIIFWLSGKTKGINGAVWVQRVRPAISRFLPPEDPSLPQPSLAGDPGNAALLLFAEVSAINADVAAMQASNAQFPDAQQYMESSFRECSEMIRQAIVRYERAKK